MHDLQAAKAIVTGGSHGLGLGIVEALLARGAAVTVIARDEARFAAAQELGATMRAASIGFSFQPVFANAFLPFGGSGDFDEREFIEVNRA